MKILRSRPVLILATLVLLGAAPLVARAQVADLQLTMTDSPDPVTAGSNVTYTITVSNAGPQDASASVSNFTPAGTTIVSFVQTSGAPFPFVWVYQGETLGGFSVGTLLFPSGASASFEFVLKVNDAIPAGATITNTARVSPPTADPVPGNNTAVTPSTVAVAADLSVTKVGPPTVVAGGNLEYEIIVFNPGPSTAQSISLTDVLPPGVAFVSFLQSGGPPFAIGSLPAVGASGTISANVPMLRAGGGGSFTLVVRANVDPSVVSISNTATVASSTAELNASNNSAGAVSTVTGQPTVPVRAVPTFSTAAVLLLLAALGTIGVVARRRVTHRGRY